MNTCSDSWNYGDDIFEWIPYNSTCLDLLTKTTIRTTFNEVLIYLYRNDSQEAFLKYSLNPKADHIPLGVDNGNPLRWSITATFSQYEGKIVKGDTLRAVLATDTNDTIEFGVNGKNTIISHNLGVVHCFPNDITQEINS